MNVRSGIVVYNMHACCEQILIVQCRTIIYFHFVVFKSKTFDGAFVHMDIPVYKSPQNLQLAIIIVKHRRLFFLYQIVKGKYFEPRCEKTGLRGFRPVRHKPCSTIIEDCKRLVISDLGSRGILLSV